MIYILQKNFSVTFSDYKGSKFIYRLILSVPQLLRVSYESIRKCRSVL